MIGGFLNIVHTCTLIIVILVSNHVSPSVVLFCLAAVVFPMGFYVEEIGGEPYQLPNSFQVCDLMPCEFCLVFNLLFCKFCIAELFT